jgi:hypothetical protein
MLLGTKIYILYIRRLCLKYLGSMLLTDYRLKYVAQTCALHHAYGMQVATRLVNRTQHLTAH